MPIKIDCPRCKNPLSVPSKMAGSYASCPRCHGRFWVPEDAPQEPGSTAPAAASPPVAAPPSPAASSAPPAASSAPPAHVAAAPPPPPGGAAAPPAGPAREKPPQQPPAPPAAPSQAPAAPPPAAPPPAAPARKAARFITAEAAESTLKLADDGKLPELHLEEGEASKQKQARQTSLNPLVLFGLLAMSMVISLVMAFVEPGSSGRSSSDQRAAARHTIQELYFGENLKVDNPPPLEPYQVLLRDAQRAYSRGDYKTERQCYRRVLGLLRGEREESEFVVGPPVPPGGRQRPNDRDLQELLETLLRNE